VIVVLIGLVIMAAGITLSSFVGTRLQTGLNALYARPPGKFQYPAWWHRLIGWLFVAFGLTTVIVGLLVPLKSN
jgi:hypothetical protein